jgi:hypothetical protein
MDKPEQNEDVDFETVATSADIIGTDYESHCIYDPGD